MSDLISRSAMRNAVRSLGEDFINEYKILYLIKHMDDARPVERTAKVIDKSVGRHSISDFDWIGKCEICGNEIQYSFDFCPYCGAKLDWSEEHE